MAIRLHNCLVRCRNLHFSGSRMYPGTVSLSALVPGRLALRRDLRLVPPPAWTEVRHAQTWAVDERRFRPGIRAWVHPSVPLSGRDGSHQNSSGSSPSPKGLFPLPTRPRLERRTASEFGGIRQSRLGQLTGA